MQLIAQRFSGLGSCFCCVTKKSKRVRVRVGKKSLKLIKKLKLVTDSIYLHIKFNWSRDSKWLQMTANAGKLVNNANILWVWLGELTKWFQYKNQHQKNAQKLFLVSGFIILPMRHQNKIWTLCMIKIIGKYKNNLSIYIFKLFYTI